jgi:hypothetical protein
MARAWALAICVLLAATVACKPASTLPVLFPAPQFDLIDQTGRPFSSSHLTGKVVVANFIFTTCTDICPLLTATMAQVRDQLKQTKLLGEKAVIVSFSVDPEPDTPAAPHRRVQSRPTAAGATHARRPPRDRPYQSVRPDRHARTDTSHVERRRSGCAGPHRRSAAPRIVMTIT